MIHDLALMIHYVKYDQPVHMLVCRFIVSQTCSTLLCLRYNNLHVCVYTLVGRISHNALLSASFYDAAIVSHFTSFHVTTVEWRILKDLKGILRDVIELSLSYLTAGTK